LDRILVQDAIQAGLTAIGQPFFLDDGLE